MKTAIALTLLAAATAAPLSELIQHDPRLADFHYTLAQSNVDLSGPGPFTIFAPVNGAFTESLGMSQSKFKTVQSDSSKLNTMMQYHIVPGQALKKKDFPSVVKTLVNGQTLEIQKDPTSNQVTILDAACGAGTLIDHDIVADNGILHLVDSAFVPQGTFCPDTVFAAEGTKYDRYITGKYSKRRRSNVVCNYR